MARSEDLKALALECLDEMKAEETIAIDLAGKTSLADTMIITSGRSQRH
ncbi:MAG: RsfS/YbeB/iojap family protein, partial [Parafilimonas terrae]|nr:RsfS/YbeB/iojap family protein [Parafilimonas terrae]